MQASLNSCLENRFFSNLVGEEGPRIPGFKGLFSKDFISAFNIHSISAVSSFSFDLSPPPLVEDPDRFYRSGEKSAITTSHVVYRKIILKIF